MLIQEMLKQKGLDVTSIAPGASIQDAVVLLAEKRIGALVVSTNGESIDGILSERDIVRSLARTDVDTVSLSVADLMTIDVMTCTAQSSIADLMELMTDKRIRHVPVVANDKLSGVVSIGDVVQARLLEVETERQQIEQYINT